MAHPLRLPHRLLSGLPALALTLCLASLLSSNARAQELDLRIGAKGLVSLSGATTPGAAPSETGPYTQAQLGIGGGAGLYGELRLSDWFGVELDLLFVKSRVRFEANVNQVGFKQDVTFAQLRVPILAKAALVLSDSFELSAGLGPELLLGLNAKSNAAVTDNRTSLDDASVQSALDTLLRAETAIGAALAVELGVAFYTRTLHFPIALRFAWNFLGMGEYGDRVNPDEMLRTLTYKAMETYQIGLVFGLGFLVPPREPPPPPVQQQGPPKDDPFSPF